MPAMKVLSCKTRLITFWPPFNIISVVCSRNVGWRLRKTNFLFMVSKNRPLSSACCSSLPFSGSLCGEIPRLLSPQGTSLKSFSVNFHPLPNSDNPLLPPTPQWRICPRSLCPPLTSFFDCSLSCRQHAAYANTRSFILEFPPPWMNATLNKDTHFTEGAVKHAHKTVGGLCALSNMLSHWRWHEPALFWIPAYPGRWREKGSNESSLGHGFTP